MADLLALSTAVIDGTRSLEQTGPMNRINFQLSEVADHIAMVEARLTRSISRHNNLEVGAD